MERCRAIFIHSPLIPLLAALLPNMRIVTVCLQICRSLIYTPDELWSIDILEMLNRIVPHIEILNMGGSFPARWIDPRSKDVVRLPRFRKFPVERQDFNYAVADVVKKFPKLHTLVLPHASRGGTLFRYSLPVATTAGSQHRSRDRSSWKLRRCEEITATAFLDECPQLHRVLIRSTEEATITFRELTRETLSRKYENEIPQQSLEVSYTISQYRRQEGAGH